jgi:hypothetical protein
MEKENDYFIKKSVGISVIHLRAAYYENNELHRHPSMDYHLHNLLYFNKELKYVGILCLDNNNLQTMPCADENYIYDALKTLNMSEAQFFIDVMDSMIKTNRFEEGLLFDRADQVLWDRFNEIKQKTFIGKFPELAKYLSAKRVELQEDIIIEEPEHYKWAEITFNEERIYVESLIAV